MATNTAASFTNHTGNGTAGPFSISFSYLAESEVDVTVGGELKNITTHYTFTSATQITFTSGNEPGNGVAIKFQRNTNVGSKKVDFVDGSVLTETDLDNNANQLLFSMQEIVDSGIGSSVQSVTGTTPIVSSGGTTPAISISAATTSAAGSMSASDKSKLDGIEASATADQTASEIKTAYESNSDTNAFTDAEKTKLTSVESNATADQTNAEIKTAYEANSDTNAFTDAEKTKLSGVEASATADQTAAEIRTLVESATDSNVFTDADHTKLNAIEANADVTDATNVNAAGAVMNSDLDGKGELLVGDGSGDPTALAVGNDGYVLKANSSTATGLEWSAAGSGGDVNQNAFSNIAVSGQDTVAADSTTDTLNIAAGSNVTITTNASNDTVTIASTDTNTTYSVGDGGLTQNNFTDALKTKLDGIEASADVTDATNVASAGAVMDGDFTSNGFMKRTGAGTYTVDTNTYLTSVPSGYLQNVSEDSSPQLGANLDVQTNEITTSTSNGNIKLNPNGTGVVEVKGDGSSADGTIQLNCSQNSHGIKLKSPPHSAGASYTLTFPNTDGNANQVLKTDGSGGLDWVDQASGGGASTGELFVNLKDSSGNASNSGVNTFSGYEAGNALASGAEYNTLYGYRAGKSQTTSDNNTLIGYQAGTAITTASSNTALGYEALKAVTTQSNNVAIGRLAGHNITASESVFIGDTAGDNSGAGSNKVIIGRSAGRFNSGNNNIIIGANASGSATTVANEITLGDTNITKFRVPGIDVVLKDNGGTPTNGHVLTVDANGEAGFAAASGGAMTFISTTELSSAASSVIFTGLDNTYPVYKLFYNFVRSGTTAQYLMWRGAVSGSEVSSIYSYHNIISDSSGANYGNGYTGCLFNNNDGLLASGELTFYNIGESNTPITAHAHSLVGDRASSPYMYNSVHAGMGEAQTGTWNGIQITTFFDQLPSGAKFSLYGIKDS